VLKRLNSDPPGDWAVGEGRAVGVGSAVGEGRAVGEGVLAMQPFVRILSLLVST